MEYRINNVIETLRRLKPPSCKDEVRRFPLLMETWEMEEFFKENNGQLPQTIITLKAKEYYDGISMRLEWTINL